MAQPAYRDEDVLRELYWDEGLNIEEVGERLNCNKDTVHKWMKRKGVERETAPQNKPVHYRTGERGYEHWRHDIGGTQHKVRVHRLQMVAEEGIDAVKGMEVHHKNRIKWDNRPSNLELVTPEEHREITSEQLKVDAADISDDQLREYVYGQQMSVNDIADEEQCKKLAVKRCLDNSPVWDRFLPQTHRDVVAYVVENNSIEFAADYFDLTKDTVKQRLRAADRCDLTPNGTWVSVEEKYDREKLRCMYHEQEMDMNEIADELGVSQGAVSRVFDKLDIETRSRGPEQGCYQTPEVETVDREYPWRDRELLYSEYVENGHGYETLATAWNTNYGTIQRWVEKFGFEKHDPTDYADQPWHDENTLCELYVERDMTMKEVADELGCSAPTIKNWLDRHNIETR